MTSLREKILTKWNEGLEAARHLVRAKVGENAIVGEPASIYHYDLRREARALEVQLDVIRDDVWEFLSKAACGPTPAEREAQRQLDLDDANAAAIAREKAAAKAEAAVEGEEPDPELESVEAELAVELDRVLGAGEGVAAHAERSLGVLMIVVGAQGSYSEGVLPEWEVCREAPRVLGALRQLGDGAGPEAVRAILCGLAEAQVCTCEAAEDDLGVVVHADDCGLCGDGPSVAAEDVIGEPGEDLEPEDLPGRPAGEPAKRRARKANGARA